MGLKNPRLTAKERGLLKGSVRRVFSRSELRRAALATAAIQHTDLDRPRVKKWSRCDECKEPTPQYLMQVDHIEPLVPITSTLEEMSMDDLIDRAWCEIRNLRPLCKPCHQVKTKEENKARRAAKSKIHLKTKKGLKTT